jgi:hypothetical protein
VEETHTAFGINPNISRRRAQTVTEVPRTWAMVLELRSLWMVLELRSLWMVLELRSLWLVLELARSSLWRRVRAAGGAG